MRAVSDLPPPLAKLLQDLTRPEDQPASKLAERVRAHLAEMRAAARQTSGQGATAPTASRVRKRKAPVDDATLDLFAILDGTALPAPAAPTVLTIHYADL